MLFWGKVLEIRPYLLVTEQHDHDGFLQHLAFLYIMTDRSEVLNSKLSWLLIYPSEISRITHVSK